MLATPVTAFRVATLGRRACAVLACALVVAALTAFVFVVRAGDAGGGNWPADWDLRVSDNGVLFQVAADIFSGRTLDWSFSPQVYVFPEIPISLAADALAGGEVHLYFLYVAVLDNVLLFFAAFAVVRQLFRADAVRAQLARVALAMVPLLVLPLVGSTRLWSYHLAPTYYFGMYLLILAAPILFLARSTPTRVAVALAIGLTGASNPLAFVFTAPALAGVAVLRARAESWEGLRRPAAWTVAVLVLAVAVRLLLFDRLQGGSPLAYVDRTLFDVHLEAVRLMLRNLVHGWVSGVVTVAGAFLAVAGLGSAVRVARRHQAPAGVRSAGVRSVDAVTLTRVYYGLVPLTGLAATFLLLITNYLYFWPVLVAPLTLVCLTVRPRRVLPLLRAAAIAFVAAALATGATSTVAHASSRYFDYRSDETRCLDEGLPPGVDVGYATFSDARRLSLTSTRPFRLIQLTSAAEPALWLTNRDYIRKEAGRFFYFNDTGDEPVIDSSVILERFGRPDGELTCGQGKTVWLYDDPAKLAAIARYYGVRSAP